MAGFWDVKKKKNTKINNFKTFYTFNVNYNLYIYIYAFSRCFYPKRFIVQSGYTYFFCGYVCSLGIEPTTFALLTQCSNHPDMNTTKLKKLLNKQTEIFLERWSKNKNIKWCGCISVHTLKLTRCWSTFWFHYSTQSWVWVYQHGTSWAIFAHSSLKKCSKSVRLQVHCLCTALFRSPHRFLIGFRSGLRVGHSKTSIIFKWSHSFVDLGVSSKSLKVLCQYWLVYGTVHNSLHLEENHRPQFQLKKNSPKAWCCHQHASQWVWCSFGDVQCWFCAKHTF